MRIIALCSLLFALCVFDANAAARDATALNREQSSATAARTATTPTRTTTARAATPTVVSRSATPTAQSRTATPANVTSRTAVSRNTTSTAQSRTAVRSATPARTATPARNQKSTTGNRGRAATFEMPTIQIASVPTGESGDYAECRRVFYDCMDEFCAVKDTQLKRCACSARANDFDAVKKQMSRVEDSLLDFSERLLTVNLDAEDAAAISIATQGETAYQTDDKSESKKILDEIATKLRKNTTALDTGRDLSALMVPIDVTSSFDNINMFFGADTTTKSGAALYNAALPVCREMVREVCNTEAATIAESGYQMLVEQDCVTVSKAYDTMRDQALARVREGGSLLEMSRLDAYQRRNADDILTCKAKMLDALTNTNVCGDNLGKCLDITGQYIDPSTGKAFLTTDLVNLTTLLTRPDAGEDWVNTAQNRRFVDYLNTRREYLEHAMDACQDISDMVWDEFLEDALAQIKLAQDAKLEEVRQSCTTLTTTCLTDAADSITDFDARALSIFGVMADKTVNGMCTKIMDACTVLMDNNAFDTDWIGGMSQIALDKTYDTILSTCAEVGKACIIRACTSINGNFGLCEGTGGAVRASVLVRNVCWNDVYACVADAGLDTIAKIMTRKGKPATSAGNFYNELYDTPPADNLCGDCSGPAGCGVCIITERIWGNCEKPYSEEEGQILEPKKQKIPDTLMWWFAVNTRTQDNTESCSGAQPNTGGATVSCGTCQAGQICNPSTGQCVSNGNTTQCTTNADCTSSQKPVCSNGQCIARPTTPECSHNSDCKAGYKCSTTISTEGQCINTCNVNGDCVSGYACKNGTCTIKCDGEYEQLIGGRCHCKYYEHSDGVCKPECQVYTTRNLETGECVLIFCPSPGVIFPTLNVNKSDNGGGCCTTGILDNNHGNCCMNGKLSIDNFDLCVPSSGAELAGHYPMSQNRLVCMGGTMTRTPMASGGERLDCSGQFLLVEYGGNKREYREVNYNVSQTSTAPMMPKKWFTALDGTQCVYTGGAKGSEIFEPQNKCTYSNGGYPPLNIEY